MTATRKVGVSIAVAGPGLAAALLLWRTQVPGGLRPPRLDPHALFTARDLGRSARYACFGRADFALATLAQLAALAWLARSPPRRSGLVTGLACVAAAWAVALPFGLAQAWWNRSWGIARGSYTGWLLGQAEALLVALAVAAVAVPALMQLGRRLGRSWWIAAVPLLTLVGATVVLVQPFLAGSTSRLHGNVYVANVHERTRAVNAQAIGIGPSARIVVWDTLLRLPQPEVRFVLAHEHAHLRRHHVWKGLGWLGLLLVPGLALVAWTTGARGGISDPRAVPVALLTALAFQLALLPLTNTISRRYEAEADWLALRSTRDPAAAIAVFHRFDRIDLEQPSPSPWAYAFFRDHPSLLQRIELACLLASPPCRASS